MGRLKHAIGEALARVQRPIRSSEGLWHLANRWSRENLYEFVEREIERLQQGPPVELALCIGAGGELGELAARLRCRRLVQVDRDPDRRPDVIADVTDLSDFADGSVEVVFLLEVLEHVAAPESAISEIHRILRKNGTLLMSVPFAFEIHDAPHDYFRFTRFGLAHLCRRFSSIEIRARNGAIKSTLVPLVRLYLSPHGVDACVGLVVLILATLLRPVISLMDRCIRSPDWTTGYVVRCVK